MKRSILFLAATFFAVSSSHADIKGRIVDLSGNPLAGVTVQLLGLGGQTSTLANGSFLLAAAPTHNREQALPKASSAFITLSSEQIKVHGLSNASPWSVMLFDVGGKMLFQTSGRGDGVQSLTLPTHHGLLFGQFRSTSGTLSFRLLPGMINTIGLPNSANGQKSPRVLAAVGASGVDTISLTLTGYAKRLIPVQAYDEDLGELSLAQVSLPANDFYRVRIVDQYLRLPHHVDVLFQSLDQNYLAITGLNDCWNQNLCVLHTDGVKVADESAVEVVPATDFKYLDRTLIVLDISTSISRAQLDSVLAATKEFIRNRVSDRELALWTFSSEVKVLNTWTQDTTALMQSLDLIQTIGPYGASTKLWGVLDTAVPRVSTSFEIENRRITRGQVVLFTDGTDTEGSATLQDVLDAVGTTDLRKEVWFVLGSWGGVDQANFKTIAQERVFVANDAAGIRPAFRQLHQALNAMNHSYYVLTYASPKRDNVDHSLELSNDNNSNTETDSSDITSYNSGSFVDGLPPEARNVKVVLDGDTLRASYEYYDAEGMIEGTSILAWSYHIPGGGELTLPSTTRSSYASSRNGGEVYTFHVTPAQFLGTPQYGTKAVATYTFDNPPVANNLAIVGDPQQGDTLVVRYNYSDKDGDLEAGTVIQWYHRGQYGGYTAIPGAVDSLYAIKDSDQGKTMAVGVKVSSATGVLKVAKNELRIYMPDTVRGWHAPTATALDFEGSFLLGGTVTATYTFNDAENDREYGSLFQWYRNGVKIDGATSASYTITASDVGKYLSYSVIPRTDGMIPQQGDSVLSRGAKVSECLNNQFTDARDGRTYQCRQVGDQVWMAEDLKFNIGTGESSDCYKDTVNGVEVFGDHYCEEVGRLYRSDYVSVVRDTLCPAGWKLPDSMDVTELLRTAGKIYGDTTFNLYYNSDKEYIPNYRIAEALKTDTGWVTSLGWSALTIPSWADSALYPNGSDFFGLHIQPTTYKNNGTFQGYGGMTVIWKNGVSVEGYRETAKFWMYNGRTWNVDYTGWASLHNRSIYYTSNHVRCVEDW